MIQLLRNENRKWQVKDIENLLKYMASSNALSGDISILSNKVQGKLREFENWQD